MIHRLNKNAIALFLLAMMTFVNGEEFFHKNDLPESSLRTLSLTEGDGDYADLPPSDFEDLGNFDGFGGDISGGSDSDSGSGGFGGGSSSGGFGDGGSGSGSDGDNGGDIDSPGEDDGDPDLGNFDGFGDGDGTGTGDDGFGDFGGGSGGGDGGFGDFGGGPSSGGNPFGGGMGGPADDFASALGGFGTDMITMMFGQCLKNIDMDKMSEDPLADVENHCTDRESITFNSALSSFEKCAGFDLKALIENFASLFVGLVMNCGSYAATVSDELDGLETGTADMEQLKAKESPLPRVPKGCVNTLVGNNPFGQAFLYSGEFPEREQKCFSELAGKLPMCTLNEWPIPIVGSWLSAFSCIYGSAQDVVMPMVEETMTGEMQTLNACIPHEISASDCKEIRNACVFDAESPALTMIMPPPFWGPPMTEKCKEMAKKSGLGDLVGRYEDFRLTCIPSDDMTIWNVAASHQDQHSGTEGGGAAYMEKAAATPESKSSALAPGDESLASPVFAKGLFVGMIVAFVGMFGVSTIRRGRRRRPVADDFDSLELAEGRDFT